MLSVKIRSVFYIYESGPLSKSATTEDLKLGATVSKNNYLAEIDGLRAIAVMAVLFYHVDLQLFSGGFIGVDVFFVISGYLITRNINTSVASGSFSFVKFYTRRFKRLYPALLATISITAIAALFILSPEHLARFGREILAALFSVSNFLFWSESGYFDLDSSFKPLLHTWSLSVEEQFYLVWPAFIVLLCATKNRNLRISILLVTAAISWWYSQLFVQNNEASTAFYMLPFRVFEFVAGAVLAVVPSLNKKHYFARSGMTLVGIVIMLYCAIAYDHNTPFPGNNALLPCFGTMLVILGGSNLTSTILLENATARWLGKISYSIYLVHWPLIVFYKYIAGEELPLVTQLLLSTISIALGYCCWRWIEQAYRHQPSKEFSYKITQLAPYSILLITLTVTLASIFEIKKGMVFDRETVLTPEKITEGKQNRYKLIRQGCNLLNLTDNNRCNSSAEKQTLLFGNSHEPDGYNIWHSAYQTPEHNIISFGTTNGCADFFVNIDSHVPDTRKCRERITKLKDSVFVKSLDTIVYSSNKPFSINKTGSYDLLAELKEINPDIQIIIMGGYFNIKKDCTFYINSSNSLDSCLTPEYIKYSREDEKSAYTKWKQSKYVRLLNPIYVDKFSLMCPNKTCIASTRGIPFAYDQHHLSLEFSQLIGKKLAKKLGDVH